MTLRPVFLMASLVLVLSACDDNDRRSPSAPSPNPPGFSGFSNSTPVASNQGQIQLISVSVPEGRVIQAEDCAVAPGGSRHICTHEWTGTFDVEFGADIEDSILSVHFDGDDGECGSSFSAGVPLAGRRRHTVTVSGIFFTDQFEDGRVFPRCVFPRTTTRMIAKLWNRRNVRHPLLTQTFNRRFTFQR